MQCLLKFGFLDGSHSLFDYGCGHGDDLRILKRMNIRASGWDPVFHSRSSRRAADIVNLGFVLNVIEDADERSATLIEAYGLAKKVMVVSVMLGYRQRQAQFTPYEDGVRTRRDTFQKYYVQEEFLHYVEKTLNTNAIPVAAGICLVFRSQMDEQLFLLARQQVRREWQLLRRDPNDRAVAKIIEANRKQIDSYWTMALELGRPPTLEEALEVQALIPLVGSRKRIHEWVANLFSAEEFEAASITRQEDLIVYFALAHFAKRHPYRRLPERLQHDVQHFFGSITKAREAGKRALFAVGNRAQVHDAAVFCHQELGIGKLSGDHHLTFHQSLLGECMPLVRIYVGCALQLFGDASSVDLIKVHLHSGKVSFLVYDDFEGDKTPNLTHRIKVDLPQLRVDFFEYGGEYAVQPLEENRREFYLN